MSAVGTGDDRMVALAGAGRRLAHATTLADLYPLATDLALGVLDASSTSLARVEHDRGKLRVLRNAGELVDWEEPAPRDELYEITQFPLLAETADRARPWIARVDDPATAPAHRDLLAGMGRTSSIWLPLIVHGTVWGGLGATRVGAMPFGPADVAAGEAYSALLSAALTRIAERDELLNLAYRDALTGLGNRRAVDDHLEQLLSSRSPGTVAVVLCDVNGLKRVNDTYGHDVGDRLLREVGTLFSRITGTEARCMAGRIGGDEFCLVVEDTTEIDLQRVTERLADGAASLPMGAGLSCGWARTTTPTADGASPNEAARALLRLADAAQYRAKRSGRDVLAAGSPGTPGGADGAESVDAATRIVALALSRLASCDGPIDQRLEAVASAFADVVDAAGWSVSVSVDQGPATVVRQGDVRQGREPRPAGRGAGTGAEACPATLTALQGGTFHAGLATGPRSKRQLLAASGFDETIGAGAAFDDRHRWMVELLGDAISLPLAAHQGLLRALVELARPQLRAVGGQDALAALRLDHEQADSTAC